MIALEPKFAVAHWLLGSTELDRGSARSAIPEIEEAARLEASPINRAWLAWGYAAGGREADARRILQSLREQRAGGGGYVAPMLLAVVHAGLGENREAMDWLDVAYEEDDSFLVFLKHGYPPLDSLSDEPRFQALIERLHLPN